MKQRRGVEKDKALLCMMMFFEDMNQHIKQKFHQKRIRVEDLKIFMEECKKEKELRNVFKKVFERAYE